MFYFFFCYYHPFSFFLVLFIYIFLLYNIVLILPYIDMNLPWVYICSPSEPPSHLPPQLTPLGHLNLDWRFISHMIIYMFRSHFPISSRPCPLSQSPKVCSIHLCFFCCLSYRVIITIFLNNIYMH